MSWLKLAVTGAVMTAGCVTEAQVEIENVAKPTPGVDAGCSDWGCGSNSPEIDSLGFHDLSVAQKANLQGYVIYGFHKNDASGNPVTYAPYVRNAQLFARQANGTVLSGGQLTGAVFDIRNDKTGLLYELRVGDTSLFPLWATAGHGPVNTWTYVLEWRPLNNGQFRNVCKNPNSSLPEDLNGFKAVLFEDDRIDADEIRVNRPEVNWFNIGCGGHALSKLHLMGHTKAAGALLGTSTTIEQRTANLKMFAADYCGTGDPFTVAGQPLRYRDEFNWVNTTNAIAPGVTPVEARWTDKGATCLNTPRIKAVMTMAGLAQFPMIEDDIAKVCHRPPPCAGGVIDMGGTHILSANVP